MDVVIVTGGSRGIGAGICTLAANRGWSVAVNYTSDEASANTVVEKIRTDGGVAIAVQADVASEDQVEAMFSRVDEELGPVTGLVNNAGIMGGGGPLDELDVAATSRMFDVNITGSFLCAAAALRRMSTKHGGKGGTIVNISSAAAKHGGPGSYIDYAASKAAIDAFTYGLAREQAPYGVRVNCVRPGATSTEMNVDWIKTHPEYLDRIKAQVPLARMAEVNEIAEAVCYMLSDASSYSTGSILDVSGGWVCP